MSETILEEREPWSHQTLRWPTAAKRAHSVIKPRIVSVEQCGLGLELPGLLHTTVEYLRKDLPELSAIMGFEFPRMLGTPTSQAIQDLLAGKFGDPQSLDPQLIYRMFTTDRALARTAVEGFVHDRLALAITEHGMITNALHMAARQETKQARISLFQEIIDVESALGVNENVAIMIVIDDLELHKRALAQLKEQSSGRDFMTVTALEQVDALYREARHAIPHLVEMKIPSDWLNQKVINFDKLTADIAWKLASTIVSLQKNGRPTLDEEL